MDLEFLELMPHTITYEPPAAGLDDWGNRTFGTAVSYRCYIDPSEGEALVRGVDGIDRRASYMIYINATSAINPEGRLTLPSGYNPQQPPILSSRLLSDENGPHHVELMI